MKRAVLVLCAMAVTSGAMGTRASREVKHAPLTMRVTTHLVQVNVIVLDRHGHPVRGLTLDDFRLFDNGKPQTITDFRVETERPPASSPKLPADVFSNYAERAGYAPPSVTVILLDALNTPFASQAYARRQVIKFLEQLQPNDRVALYALNNRLVVLHDFTSDAASLLDALHLYQAREVRELHSAKNAIPQDLLDQNGSDQSSSSDAGGTDSEYAEVTQWLSSVQDLGKNYYARQRVRITTNALIAIANHLKGLPGRKNLVWVSGGFPLWRNLDKMLKPDNLVEIQNFSSSVSRAVRALNNANLAIYPVDARGLMVDPDFSATQRTMPRRIKIRFLDTFATMDELARRTGGRAFYNSNDVRGSIRRVVDDSRISYVLAYYPKDVKWNGEFRKIKVQVRRHGLRLQYRHGYSAMPEKKHPVAAGNQTLNAVLASPLDATGIGLAVQMTPDRSASTETQPVYLVHFEVDPRDITFKQKGGLWNVSMTLVTDEIGPKGESLGGAVQKVGLHLKDKVYRGVLAKGMGFNERLPFPVLYNAERLRIVIRDDPTGAMGSVNVPLDQAIHPPKRVPMKRKSHG